MPAGAAKRLPAVSGSPKELRLERTHLALVARGLVRAEPSIQREVLAAKDAWPGIAHGLPREVSAQERAGMRRALLRTEALATPRFISYAGELTGAAAPIAGLLLSFEQLSQRGWSFTLATAQKLGGGSSPAAQRFLRVNAFLYLGCIYDAHYNLSVIGERMREAYAKLGGASAFGAQLPPGVLAQLAGFYAPGVVRLAPKPPASAAGG